MVKSKLEQNPQLTKTTKNWPHFRRKTLFKQQINLLKILFLGSSTHICPNFWKLIRVRRGSLLQWEMIARVMVLYQLEGRHRGWPFVRVIIHQGREKVGIIIRMGGRLIRVIKVWRENNRYLLRIFGNQGVVMVLNLLRVMRGKRIWGRMLIVYCFRIRKAKKL